MMKTCRNCQKEFSGTGSGKHGRSPFCPACLEVGEGKKRCCKCLEVKAVDQFGKYRGRPQSKCSKCMYQDVKRWVGKNSEKARIYKLNYDGIACTAAQYNEMLQRQGGVCAICHRVEARVFNGKPTALSVDHDHATGKVRGLLCCRCNLTIGKMEDNPDLLRNAVFYLEQHRCS